MKTAFILPAILLANGLYFMGALMNGYSVVELLPGFLAKLTIEVVSLVHAVNGKASAVFVLLFIWILTCVVSIWYCFRDPSIQSAPGLLLNALLYVLMSIMVIQKYRESK